MVSRSTFVWPCTRPGGPIWGRLAQIVIIRLMDKILHDLKDPRLWELWYIPYFGSCRILAINRTVLCHLHRRIVTLYNLYNMQQPTCLFIEHAVSLLTVCFDTTWCSHKVLVASHVSSVQPMYGKHVYHATREPLYLCSLP